MKKMLPVLICFIMAAVSLTIPAAAETNRLFDIDPGQIDTLQVRTGFGSEQTYHAPQDAEIIGWIAESLNEFEYEETVDLTGNDGWYVLLNITDQDGTEQELEIAMDGAFDPNSPKRIKCVSTKPDCFGESWMKLAFSDPFSDVNLWQDSSVKFVYDNHLMLGTGETSFSPEAPMTRGMFVTVLGRMAEIDTADYSEAVFEDVSAGNYCFPYVSWAAQNDIVRGNGQDFSPHAVITREQVVLMLARCAEAQQLTFQDRAHIDPSFTDIEHTSEEFREKLPALFRAYVVSGSPDFDTFDPEGGITRAEAADLFYRVYDALSLL